MQSRGELRFPRHTYLRPLPPRPPPARMATAPLSGVSSLMRTIVRGFAVLALAALFFIAVATSVAGGQVGEAVLVVAGHVVAVIYAGFRCVPRALPAAPRPMAAISTPASWGAGRGAGARGGRGRMTGRKCDGCASCRRSSPRDLPARARPRLLRRTFAGALERCLQGSPSCHGPLPPARLTHLGLRTTLFAQPVPSGHGDAGLCARRGAAAVVAGGGGERACIRVCTAALRAALPARALPRPLPRAGQRAVGIRSPLPRGPPRARRVRAPLRVRT